MDNLLEIRNLSIELPQGKKKPVIKLVDGVDLTIKKKQNFGVVGESGCGKSITCSSIMSLLSYPLTVGKGSSIRFQKEDGQEVEITKLSPAEMRKIRGKDISMIFQEPMTALDPMYTIEEQINETLRFHTNLTKAEMHDVALEMLKKVKIPRAEEILKDYPHHLSGGMLQRVMIAIALINNPRLLIADEPTTALDVTIQGQILDIIKQLQRERNTSVIMITHDLGVVANMAQKIAVMYSGKIVERGNSEDIFYRPRHPYTWALIRSVPRLDLNNKQTLASIPGTPPDLLNPPAGCPFCTRCEYCMNICKEHMPEYTDFGNGHEAACWLHHPMAPKVEMPEKGDATHV